MQIISSFHIPLLSSIFPAQIIGVSQSRLSIEFLCVFFFTYVTTSAENHRRPDYMGAQALRSPEELLGAHCGTNTDMWALGCVVRNSIHSHTYTTLEPALIKLFIAFRINNRRRSIRSHIPNTRTRHRYKRRISSYPNA